MPAARRTVTARVLSLLDAFDDQSRTLTLSRLAARSGLPLSTAHRLVGELVDWGALERHPDGAYGIGIHLWEVGALSARNADLRATALPYLQDLFAATGQNVQLAVLDGTDAVYLERIAGRHSVHAVTRAGSRLPLHATSVGQVLLAHAGPALLEQVLARPLRSYTERTITDPAGVRRALAEVRRTGVAVCRGQVELISASIAAPVTGPDGAVLAAVGVVVPVGEQSRPYVLAVQLAARSISRAVAAEVGPQRG